MKTYSYKIEGLHCPSCVLVIEDRLEKEKGVQSVNVDLKNQKVTLVSKKIISPKTLNQIFSDQNYQFFESKNNENDDTVTFTNQSLWWFWAALIIGAFLLLSQLGLTSFININSNSSFLAIFVFGLIAGFSSCGALLSGIILSQPKNTKTVLFGRIIAYTILGGLLGVIGQQFTVSPLFTTILMVIVSLIMIVIALQMLNIKFAQQINLALPKTFTKSITHQQTPFFVGLLTVFLPCGFTLLTEGVAILSGSFIRGLLIMLVFVLGTSIPLFLIGLSSDKLIKNQKLIGALILFFVLYNLDFNFGITRQIFNQDINQISNTSQNEPSANYENAIVLESTYSSATDMVPSQFTVKKGQPVRMVIDVNDNGYGCMSTVMIPGLYNKPQPLVKGKQLIMEFVPNKVGTYQITCAMGVPRGEINVTE